MKLVKKGKSQEVPNPKKWKKCEAFGNRCTICGAYFEDDVCSNRHIIGHSYQF